MKTTKTIIIVLFSTIGIYFTACNKEKPTNIIIGYTLRQNNSIKEIRRLEDLIKKALNKDEKSLSKINYFSCDGEGSYELGFIITQIIYKLSEKDFINMVNKLTYTETKRMKGLISVGLEYGDNDNDGNIDNNLLKDEFPDLLNILNTKNE